MFRAAAVGPFDDAVAKATDENLTSEDWGAIMEVCDKATSDPTGPKEAVQSMIKRLAHRNANVQLYTLELAHALCQNCGKPMHREVSSRAFSDALLKLANDRNTHQQVKSKILEKMKDWSDMFSKDADLGIMYDAYYRLKQTNPTLQAPSAPQKQGLTASDRQKEDEELQMALKLSLQEDDRKKAATSSSSAQPGSSSKEEAAPAPPVPAGTTAATVSRVRALFDFAPSEPGELEFKKGDVIAVLESVYKDWWRGSLKGNTGIFPLNYVEKLTDPTPDELQREAQMEAEVFAEIKNVEKLLTLLSASNTGPREEDNEEISKLYHQTLAIRPKLIKLIEKYSQKKDDFTQLNEKFIKARRDYESLLESSMAHPPQHNYQQYAMRPGQGYPQPVGYPSQPPPSQEPNQYYNPAPPAGPGSGYQASSPPPNFPPSGQPGNAPTLATWLAGSLVDVPWVKDRKVRALTAWVLIALLNSATWIWAVIIQNEYQHTHPTLDWGNLTAFGRGFGLYIFERISLSLVENYIYWCIGNLSDSPGEQIRYSSLLRGIETAGIAIGFGVQAVPTKLIATASINLTLWFIAFPFSLWATLQVLRKWKTEGQQQDS